MVLLGSVPVQLCLSPCLLAVGLQKGVLVAVQVVHQVPIAAVLGDDVDGPWWETAPVSALPRPRLLPGAVDFVPQGHYQVAGCLGRARGKSYLSGTEHFWNLKFVFGEGGGG